MPYWRHQFFPSLGYPGLFIIILSFIPSEKFYFRSLYSVTSIHGLEGCTCLGGTSFSLYKSALYYEFELQNDTIISKNDVENKFERMRRDICLYSLVYNTSMLNHPKRLIHPKIEIPLCDTWTHARLSKLFKKEKVMIC